MIRSLATLVLIAAALAVHFHGLLPFFPNPNYDFDAIHVYLPHARRLIAEGPAFFLAEESIQVPPFSYAWPALLGAELATVKGVNLALSGVVLVLVARTATLWHSRLAGVLAAFAFAATPLLKPFLATAITEPPYLFLMATWIWALSEWRLRGREGYLPIAGIALGLALLTRASLFYALLAFLPFLLRSRPALFAHLLALAFPLAFIAKNALAFGFPFFTTGAGNALYLGTSPLFGGYDPWYVGLIYDVGAITGDQSHLTLKAEALLGGAARILLSELDPGYIATMYAKKLAAFLFVTNAESVGDVVWLRGWRIATLVLSLVGLAALRDRWLRWVVAGVIVYQVAAHIPGLYSHRYSVGALDVWLATLAGVGLAALWQRGRWKERAAVAAVALAGITAGAHFASSAGKPEPDVLAAKNVLVWERRDEKLRFSEPRATLTLEVANAPDFSPWFNHVLLVDSTLTRGTPNEACGLARISYRRNSDGKPSAPLEWRFVPDGKRRVHQLGAEVPLRLGAEGRLAIDMNCAPGSTWEIHRIAVYSARGALALRERLVSSPGPAAR